MFAACVLNPWDHQLAYLPWHMGTVCDILPISNPHMRLFLYCKTGMVITDGNTELVDGQRVLMGIFVPFQILFTQAIYHDTAADNS